MEWNDINFDNNKLTISKILAEVESSPDTKVTKVASQSAKTNAGKRIISIDKETMLLLQEWKIRQQFEFNVLGFKTTNWSSPIEKINFVVQVNLMTGMT